MQKQALTIYNELFRTSKFIWSDVEPSELPASTKQYVNMWLVDTGTTFKLHKPVINNVFVFKVDNKSVVYLIHDANAESHMWGDKNFENLDNNTALATLAGAESLKRVFDTIDRRYNYANN